MRFPFNIPINIVLPYSLLVIALVRLINRLSISWVEFKGDFLCGFPYYFKLDQINPSLYQSVKAYSYSSFENGWYYGPVHHFFHYILILASDNIEFFMRLLLIIYILLIVYILIKFAKETTTYNKHIFTVYIFALTFGSFAFLENLQQRNIELLELILLIAMYIALKHKKWIQSSLYLSLTIFAKLIPAIYMLLFLKYKNRSQITSFFVFSAILILLTSYSLDWNKWLIIYYPSGVEAKYYAKHLNYLHDFYGLFIHFESIQEFMNSPFILMANNLEEKNVLHTFGGSFYQFIVALFTPITFQKSGLNFSLLESYLLPNSLFIIILLISFFTSVYYINKSKSHLFTIATTALLMLLVLPLSHPYYYVFNLLSLFYITRQLFCLRNSKKGQKPFIAGIIAFIIINIMLCNFIPVSFIDSIFQIKSSIEIISIYGVFGFATLLLLILTLYINQQSEIE